LLVQQAVDQKLLAGTSKALEDSRFGSAEQAAGVRGALVVSKGERVRRADLFDAATNPLQSVRAAHRSRRTM
jgi:hypothetical protein